MPVYDLMVPYENAFASPAEGSVPVSLLELPVGKLLKLLDVDIADQL